MTYLNLDPSSDSQLFGAMFFMRCEARQRWPKNTEDSFCVEDVSQPSTPCLADSLSPPTDRDLVEPPNPTPPASRRKETPESPAGVAHKEVERQWHKSTSKSDKEPTILGPNSVISVEENEDLEERLRGVVKEKKSL